MSDEDLKVDNPAVASDRGTDRSERSTERAERAERGEAHELSGGKRDRSREMLRAELEASFNEARGKDDRADKRDWEPAGRAARKAKDATAEKPGRDRDAAVAAGAPGTEPGDAATGAETTVDTSAPPKSWRAEERAEYNRLPETIKNAVHRRENEMAKGVAELKQKYQAEDAAWAPHEPVLRQFSKSRAETVTTR
jgi:hypothetical protein